MPGPELPLITHLPGQKAAGSCPSSLAESADGARLFVADACINTVAVFDMAGIRHSPITAMSLFPPLGLIPTDWYPTALATVGDDLLIATSKGQGTGPNNFPGVTGYERKRRKTAYIPTLLYGSLSRVNIPEIEKQLPSLLRERTRIIASGPILATLHSHRAQTRFAT